MQKTLAEIAKVVHGRVVGNAEVLITGISGIKEAQTGDLTFLANPKYLPLAAATRASAIIVGKDVLIEGQTVLQVESPSLAFAQVAALFKEALIPKIVGIHPSAVIAPDAKLAEGVGIGPNVVIEAGAKIGRGSVICAGSYIGQKSVVGEGCLIYPNVTVREDVTIGNNVIIHSGTVVGSDGFGYAKVGDQYAKIPQMGTVVIEDDVELGACVTVDRARFDKTVIGKGSKIDNLVQIAHNVRLGENCIIVALTGIAGSATLGKNVVVAGQAGIAGHLTVGDKAAVMAQSGVIKNVPPGVTVFGTPAEEYKQTVRMIGNVSRLPRYIETIKTLESRVAALEEQLRSKNV